MEDETNIDSEVIQPAPSQTASSEPTGEAPISAGPSNSVEAWLDEVGGSGEGVGAEVVKDTASEEAHSKPNFVLDLSTGEEVATLPVDMTASSTDGLVSEPGPEVVSPTSNSVFPTPEVSVSSADKLTSQIPVNEPLPFDKAQDLRPTELAKPSYRELWGRFLEKLKIGKRKKLDKVMTLFVKKSKVENEDVQKLLRVSDATAERYLNILEKESKVRQVGKTGKYTYYEKI